MPERTKAQQAARKRVYDSIDKDIELAKISSETADLYEKRYKALIAKYGDLEPNSYRKLATIDEERKTRKQAERLLSRPYEVKRYEKKLKEALEYENQPKNKADKERLKNLYDEEGRPAILDYPELTRSDEYKETIRRLRTGF